MAEQALQVSKKTWLMVFALFALTVFVFILWCLLIEFGHIQYRGRGLKPLSNTLRWTYTTMAAAAWMASVGWLFIKTNQKTGNDALSSIATKTNIVKPDVFFVNSIIALAFSQMCMTYGLVLFFKGMTIVEFLPFAIATLSVDLFYILPRGLKYWSSWEQEQKAKGQQANSSFSQSL